MRRHGFFAALRMTGVPMVTAIAVIFICGPLLGQMTTLTASHITDAGGNPVTGELCLTPASAFVRGGGGQIVPTKVCFSIAAGVLEAGASVADTSKTNPKNICYAATILNADEEPVAKYLCFQPTGATYDFDEFVEATPAAVAPSFTLPQFLTNGVANDVQNQLDIKGSGVSYAAGVVTITGSGGSGTGLNWKEDWAAGTSYVTGDAVSYLGSSYAALKTNIGVVPGTDATAWQLLAQAGATGATGATGAQGEQGPQGPQGIQGPKGDTGATGTPGAAATVAVGSVSTGAAGSSASVTNTGTSQAAVLDFMIPRGATGAQGEQGAQGIQGPQGPSGGSTNWRGAWSAATAYAQYDAVSYEGSSYICTVANTGAEPDTNSSDWQLLAQAGATGATGTQGEQGVQGIQGPKGDAGTAGTPGAAATVAVGSVATGAAGSSASVTNTGTSQAAVLDFMIPRGATGAQGEQGEQGIQGIQGPKGDAGTAGATGAAGPNVVSTTTATTISGLLKGNGSTVAPAVAGTDYQAPLGYTPLNPANNLSDVANAATARSNLGAQAALGFTPENAASKNAANGYAPLDANKQVPLTNLPTIPFSQLSGAPSIPTSSDWPNAGSCSAGNFETGDVNGSAPNCAAVSYNNITGTPVLPTTMSASSHKWLASYNSSTGTFTETQPAFSDLTGTATASQIPASLSSTNNVNGTQIPASATLTRTIASGTTAMPTSAIAAASCSSAVTATATGVASTDVINASASGDPTSITGYKPGAMLTIVAWTSANQANFKVCNSGSASATPDALNVNWNVTR